MNEDLLKFFDAIMSGQPMRSDVVGNDVVGDYTIDTCHTLDCGYETAINKNNGFWVVVQRYKDRELAEKGHKIWCGICAGAPEKVYSVQTGRYEEF